jgi:pimeloyl-ACP methyl ester carboxylesterase
MMDKPLLVTLGTSHIAYDQYGDGRTSLLLLHGIPGWRGNWAGVAALLGPGYRVVVPDLMGFGESGPAPGENHAAGQSRALAHLLDALGLESVHLAGFDFGGPIAVTLLRDHPSRVRSLALLATNVFPDTPVPLPLRIARVPIAGEVAFRIMMGRTGQRMLWIPATRNRRAFPWSRYRRVLQFPRGVASTREIFLQSLRHLDRLYCPIAEHLPRITVPATVMWGTADPFFPVSVGRRTAAAIPGARYVEIPNCGHFVPEEQPDLVARELARLAG